MKELVYLATIAEMLLVRNKQLKTVEQKHNKKSKMIFLLEKI